VIPEPIVASAFIVLGVSAPFVLLHKFRLSRVNRLSLFLPASKRAWSATQADRTDPPPNRRLIFGGAGGRQLD
jgi:hypothetical protein